MKNIVYIQCPTELLVSLQLNSEKFAEVIKLYTAIALFEEGKISSGMAARWLEIPRVTFLLQAMEMGAELLENSQDDFEREMSLFPCIYRRGAGRLSSWATNLS